MSAATHPKQPDLLPGEVKTGGWNFAPDLDDDETLTGDPTVTATQVRGVSDPDGVQVSAATVNAAEETIDGQTVAAGKGLLWLFTVASDAVAGQRWRLLITVTTSAGQTLKERVYVTVA